MYELANVAGFERAVRAFVGSGRVSWYEDSASAADQLLLAFYGASSDPTRVRPDLLQFDACAPHNCAITGALYVNTSGTIVGAALLYSDCTDETCEGGRKLIILRDPQNPDVALVARKWGEDQEARWNEGLQLPPEPLSGVDLIDVPIRVPKR
jgi:hypothetical protein